jgi:hypothetical protein
MPIVLIQIFVLLTVINLSCENRGILRKIARVRSEIFIVRVLGLTVANVRTFLNIITIITNLLVKKLRN